MSASAQFRTIAGFAVMIAVAGFSNGCGGGGKTETGKPAKSPSQEEHAEHGPHGGELAAWGEHEFHVEVTIDKKQQSATVYILDSAAKKATPIAAKTVTLTLKQPVAELTLAAEPQEGDPEGSSSRFTGKHEALANAGEVAGTVSGTVKEKPYAGDFPEHGHKH
jgi:hypothetical protein